MSNTEAVLGEVVTIGDSLPVLTFRNGLFPLPGAVVPYDLGREAPDALVEALLISPVVAIFGQHDPSTEDPDQNDLDLVGCAARILKAKEGESGNATFVLHGLQRIRLDEITQRAPYLAAKITRLPEQNGDDDEARALATSLREIAHKVIKVIPELPPEAPAILDAVTTPSGLADLIASNADASWEEKRRLVQTTDVKNRLCHLVVMLSRQLEAVQLKAVLDRRISAQFALELEAVSGPRLPDEELRKLTLRVQRKVLLEELGKYESAHGEHANISLRFHESHPYRTSPVAPSGLEATDST